MRVNQTIANQKWNKTNEIRYVVEPLNQSTEVLTGLDFIDNYFFNQRYVISHGK